MGLHGFGSPQILDTMISSFHPPDECMLESQLNLFNDWSNCSYPITSNSIYSVDSDECFYQENSATQFSPCFPGLQNITVPENFPVDHMPIDCCYLQDPKPKRLRITYDECFPADYCLPCTLLGSVESTAYGGYLVMSNSSPVFRSPDVLSVSLNYQKPEAEAVALSTQSIAARQRRKKISEKTQELGRLVPGGVKMNTAEMLAAAAKYVKFLQAQVRIMEFLKHSFSYQENEKAFSTLMQLHDLVTSSTIQEKLYEEEKCILPIECLKTLQENGGLQKSDDLWTL